MKQVVFVPFETSTGWQVVSGTTNGVLLENQKNLTSSKLKESEAELLCVMAKIAVREFCELNGIET